MSTQDQLYDVVICGAGSSGLGLAHHLSSQSHDLKIALIDSNFKESENKTWCIWDESSIPDQKVIHHTWNEISVQNKNTIVEQQLNDYTYSCILNDTYRSVLLNQIKDDARFVLIEDQVKSIKEDINSKTAIISCTKHSNLRSKKVFDSTLKNWYGFVQPSSNVLLQHFVGWEIKTNQDCFNPTSVQLMDFRISQEFGFAFVYVLPFEKNRALVELTYFSKKKEDPSHYPFHIKKYLQDHFNLKNESDRVNNQVVDGNSYQILRTESGIIPMIDLPFKYSDSSVVYNIGLQGGLAKPSTGYAFSRIQRDVREIATNLVNNLPIDRIQSPFRFRFYDMLILHIINEEPKKAQQIFMALFQKNGFDTMFKFLDEKTGFFQDLKIMASVPSYFDFFKAIAKMLPKITKL